MDKEVKEFLESLSNGLTPTVSYPEWESWITATAERLLGKYDKPEPLKFCKYRNIRSGAVKEWALDQARNVMVDRRGQQWAFGGEHGFLDCNLICFNDPPKSPQFHEYYNILTGETARWARDNSRLEMLDEYGHICTSNDFYDNGWRLSADLPPYPGQSDLDDLKRDMVRCMERLEWLEKHSACLFNILATVDGGIQQVGDSIPCPSPQYQQLDVDALKRQVVILMERVECLEANGRMVYSKVEQLEASSRLETTRLSDLARKLDSLFN